jgi:hypothetical protein
MKKRTDGVRAVVAVVLISALGYGAWAGGSALLGRTKDSPAPVVKSAPSEEIRNGSVRTSPVDGKNYVYEDGRWSSQ